MAAATEVLEAMVEVAIEADMAQAAIAVVAMEVVVTEVAAMEVLAMEVVGAMEVVADTHRLQSMDIRSTFMEDRMVMVMVATDQLALEVLIQWLMRTKRSSNNSQVFFLWYVFL